MKTELPALIQLEKFSCLCVKTKKNPLLLVHSTVPFSLQKFQSKFQNQTKQSSNPSLSLSRAQYSFLFQSKYSYFLESLSHGRKGRSSSKLTTKSEVSTEVFLLQFSQCCCSRCVLPLDSPHFSVVTNVAFLYIVVF